MAVKVRTVQDALPTVSGDHDVTLAGFGETVKGVLSVVTLGTTNGTAANGASISFGASDGTRTRVLSLACAHNVTSSDTWRQSQSDELIAILTGTGGINGHAAFDSFQTNGYRINVAAGEEFNAAYLNNSILFGGSDTTAYVNHFDQSALQDASQSVTGVGFEPDVIFFFGHHATNIDSAATAQNYGSIGFAVNSTPIVQGCIVFQSRDNRNPADDGGWFRDNRITHMPGNSPTGEDVSLELTSFDTDGFTTTKRAGGALVRDHCYAALNFNGVIEVIGAHFTSPTSTGNDAQTWPGHQPQLVWLLGSVFDALNTGINTESSGAGALFVSAFDPDNAHTTGISSEDAVSPTDTQSLTGNIAIDAARGTGAAVFTATHVSMNTDGYTLNYSATDGTARREAGVSFEEPDAGAGGRIMSSLVGPGGLVFMGGIAGRGGGLVG